MVASGVAVYFTMSSSFGDNAFTPVQPRINPVTFNPAETIDSTGSPHGEPNTFEMTKIGNSSWCALATTQNSTFDLGQSVCLGFGGLYNNSHYPSGGVFLDIYNPSSSLVKQCHSNFILLGTTSSSPPVVCSFSTTGKWTFQVQVCTDPSTNTIQYSALEPLMVYADPTLTTPTTSPSHDPIETSLPISITFSTTESGGASPLSYQWEINGTEVSGATSSTFTHTFTGYASYTIAVNVIDATGYKVTSTPITETIYPPLKVSFSVSPNPGDIGENIVLTATASGGSGSYSSYIFSINGAGHTETTDSYTTTFSSSGSYPMNVSVTDSAGYTAYSLNTTELISTQLAAVISSSIPETQVDYTVTFTSSVSGGTPPYTYSWSVSDNGTAIKTGTEANISVYPTEAGNLSAKLIVKDNRTNVFTAYKNITVAPALRLINYYLSNSVKWVVSQPVTIYASFVGGISPYLISLEIPNGPDNGQCFNVPYGGGANFSYTFTPSQTASTGSQIDINFGDSLCEQDAVLPNSYSLSEPQTVPYVQITASPQRGIAPLTVDFTGFIETSTSGSVNSAYNWTFSNGVNTLTQNPVETFSAGNYTATLTADSSGEVNSASLTIVSLPLPATFSYSPHTGGTVLTVYNFTAKTAWWVTSYNITWTFPNGNQEYGNFTHYQFKTYSPTQNVSAVISYTNGSYTSYLNVKMTPAPITADFSLPTFIPVQTLISVNATVNDPDSNQITYVWNFNGQNYTGASQLFYLGNPQVYNITLTVTDQYGMTYTITKNVTAVIPSNDGNITISVITKTNGPYTTYDLQIYSKDGISVVEALLGTQTLSPTFLNDTDGYWYQLTLNQGSYYAGTYSLEFIVFDKAAQSNSKTVSFFVSQTYGKSSGGFSLTSFFGNTETEIIAIISIVSTIGGAIIYSRDKKDRDTQYFNIDGAVVKAKRTPGSFKQFEKKTRNKGKGGS
jgi:PKD repeat protein